MKVHPIETESYRRLAERVDLSRWPIGPAAVAARIVHATAEPALVDDLVVTEGAVAAGVAALRAGAPVLCDVEMVRAGITGAAAVCAIGDVRGEAGNGRHGGPPTRAAAAMGLLAARHPEGAVVVVGCAPTALEEVNQRIRDGILRPALVVGVPVGFVGATEAKEALLELSELSGVPSIVLRGERGGAAVAAAALNALVRLAAEPSSAGPPSAEPSSAGPPSLEPPSASRAASDLARAAASSRSAGGPGCLLIGHGSRSDAGAHELRRFCESMASARPGVATVAGFIEFMEPGLDEAIDQIVATGVRAVVAVPLVLLGAGHMKDDGPAALSRARTRHPGVRFSYARDLGVHPDVLAAVSERVHQAAEGLPGRGADAVVVVGRGSTDPDANADLAKAARLLADGRGLTSPSHRDGRPVGEANGAGTERDSTVPDPLAEPPPLGLVVPGFVSLARPGVADALDQVAALGARRIAVVPYFLFDGLLVDRIRVQAVTWASSHPGFDVAVGAHMGVDPGLVALAWHRFDEASGGPVHMNCDGCLYRTPLPGYEHRVASQR